MSNLRNLAKNIYQRNGWSRLVFNHWSKLRLYGQIPLHPYTAKQFEFQFGRWRSHRENQNFNRFVWFSAYASGTSEGIRFNASWSDKHCFLDDTIIALKGSQSEHLDLVYNCMDNLDQEKFCINLKKCHFLKCESVWLGHHITQTGIRLPVSKTSAL